jgi:hypothetical protein
MLCKTGDNLGKAREVVRLGVSVSGMHGGIIAGRVLGKLS